MPIDLVRPGLTQPRRRMDKGPIRQLAHSIAEKGILQPLLVRRHAEEAGAFEIVAGERRWRAAQMARLHEIPVVVKELSDSEALEIALALRESHRRGGTRVKLPLKDRSLGILSAEIHQDKGSP